MMIEYVLALIMCASIGCLAYSIGLVAKNLQEMRNVLQKIREEIRYGCTLYEKYSEKTENKKIDYIPYPIIEPQNPDWWQNPPVIYKCGSVTSTNMTAVTDDVPLGNSEK